MCFILTKYGNLMIFDHNFNFDDDDDDDSSYYPRP
jgi:hypothetical protein